MKLLIKKYLRDMNSYDLMQILDVLKSSIKEEDTKIIVITNDSTFDFKPYEYYYSHETNIPIILNYKLDEIEWDIVMPIFRPSIATRGFDTIIKKLYKEKFPNFDGVLWFNDNIQKDIATFPVIGRKYYEKYGYIFNEIYSKKNFEEEFTDILKLNKKYYYEEKVIFKIIQLKSDDDNIYEMRKKINFCE